MIKLDRMVAFGIFLWGAMAGAGLMELITPEPSDIKPGDSLFIHYNGTDTTCELRGFAWKARSDGMCHMADFKK